MIYTTLNQIRAKGPCGLGPKSTEGFRKLLVHLGKSTSDDEPLGFDVILASNGIDDALWCLRSVDEPRFCRLLAVKFARGVQHLMKDPRSISALDVAERFASGSASAEELAEAREGTYAAYSAADAAAAAADAAAYAADAAVYSADAAYAAVYSADAYAAYSAAADAAADAADAAARYARYADRGGTKTQTQTKQAEIFLQMLKEHAR